MQVNRTAAVVLASQDLQSSGEGLPPSTQTLPFPADTVSSNCSHQADDM